MKFYIGTQFSKEFDFHEILKIKNHLENKLNNFFLKETRDYNVENIYVNFICVSKGFEQFFKIKPLKISKIENTIEYEIKIDYTLLIKSSYEEKIKILIDNLLSESKRILDNSNLNLSLVIVDLYKCFSN